MYSVPRRLYESDGEAAGRLALSKLREESLKLRDYMAETYNLQIQIEEKTGACLFPTSKRWLKGEEYAFLIRHFYAYSRMLAHFECQIGHHPNSVYNQPHRKCCTKYQKIFALLALSQSRLN